MKKLYKQIRAQIEKVNASYKDKADKHRKPMVFNPGDLVWLHLMKERFPSRRKNKLMAQGEGLSRFLKRLEIMPKS